MDQVISLVTHIELYNSALLWGALAGAACGFLLVIAGSCIVHWSN